MAQSYELWNAIGKQIDLALKSKTGISIPGLGQFIFKDAPMFIAAPSLNLKSCVIDSGVFRPVSVENSFNCQMIDFEQVAVLAKLKNRDEAKALIETFVNLVKSKTVSEFKQEIPSVGSFVVRGNNVAVRFVEKDVSVTHDAALWLKSNLGIDLRPQSCRPKTAQGNKKSLPNSTRNLSRPASAKTETESQVPRSRSLGTMKNKAVEIINSYMPKITLTMQAKDQTNRGLISYAEFMSVLSSIDPTISESQVQKLIAATNCAAGGRVRYKIFLQSPIFLSRSGLKSGRSSIASDYTDNYNSFSLAPIARLIWDKKLVISEMSQSTGMRPRLEVQPSEILSILKKSGIFINIHQLKAILRECENNSILSLLKTCKLLSKSPDDNSFTELPRPYSAMVNDQSVDKIRNHLAGSNLSSVYAAASKSEDLHVDDFVNFIASQSYGKIKPIEAQQAFYKLSKGEDLLSEHEFCRGFSKYETCKMIQDRGFKFLRAWLRQERLSTEQGFDYLLSSSKSSSQIQFNDWVRVLKLFDYNLYEATVLFEAIDTKQDRVIDLSEWINKVYEEEGPLQSFKDTVLKYSIDKEDLLIKLNAHSKQRLTIEEMAEGLRRMDPTLTVTNAVNMSRAAAGSKGYIDVQDFLAQLSQKPEEFQGNWKEQILRKIQNKVKGDLKDLRRLLEEADLRNSGKLELVKFQEVLNGAGLGLDYIEIDRLSRVLDRKANLTIDYNEFLDHLEGPNLPPIDPLKSTAARLQVFLQQNEMTAGQLIKKLGTRVPIEKFSKFLKKKVQKNLNEELLDEISEKFDVNKDGVIDINDLKAILESKIYLDLQSGSTFPTQALTKDKARDVLKVIRTALIENKISFVDAFKIFDCDNLGVLNAKQFSNGLGKYVDLSEPIKNGLFALIDKLGTGLITQEAFLSVIKDTNLAPKPSKDSWTWETEKIEQIRKWIKSQLISVENAFRAFDSDFDGIISKEDLKSTLISIFKLPAQECTSSRIDRLYKLIDHFKRNSIQLSDFKLLFEEGETPEWKTSAKQQVGLFISQNYPNLKLAFESVSELTGKIKLDQFHKWVDKNQILKGFNLTQELIEKLFAELDPHRKAFVTESDFCLAFGGISYQSQCIQEIKDAIRSNFQDVHSAFDFFSSFKRNSDKLVFAEFAGKVASLVPKRFSQSDLRHFWDSLWGTGSISFEEFSKEFQDLRFTSQFSRQSKKSSNHSTPSSFLSVNSDKPIDPLRRLQSLIKASPISLEDIFKEIDSDESGKLSAVEFRKALRKLNIGLSARDIDNILSRIDTNNDGVIDWQEFFKAFKSNETEKVTNGVAVNRIKKMKENMSHFMLSAKDAFLQFDPDRSGFLDFQKFSSLVHRLSSLAGEQVPAFTVLKDLYDIIDIRKDGVLDLREWLNTFKGDQKLFEDSKEFDQLSMLIARNRKVIGITFEAMSRNGKVDLQKAKDVLMSVARHPKVDDEVWDRLLGVAIRDGGLDYKFFLEIYKDRALHKQWHPRPKSSAYL